MHQMAAQDYISRLQSGAAAAGLHSLAGLPQYEALAGQRAGWQGTGAGSGHVDRQVRLRVTGIGTELREILGNFPSLSWVILRHLVGEDVIKTRSYHQHHLSA